MNRKQRYIPSYLLTHRRFVLRIRVRTYILVLLHKRRDTWRRGTLMRYQWFCVDTRWHGVVKQCLITSINVILVERFRIFESWSKIIR